MIYVWAYFSPARAVSDGTRKDVKYAKTAAVAAAVAAAKAETSLRRAAMALAGGWGFCCVNGRSD